MQIATNKCIFLIIEKNLIIQSFNNQANLDILLFICYFLFRQFNL